MATAVRRVIGIELSDAAVADARANASLNEIDNATFLASKAEDAAIKRVLTGLTAEDRQHLVAIVDPPRAGLHNDVVKALRACEPLARLLYVSCHAPGFVANAVQLCRPASKAYAGAPFEPKHAWPLDLFRRHRAHRARRSAREAAAAARLRGRAARRARPRCRRGRAAAGRRGRGAEGGDRVIFLFQTTHALGFSLDLAPWIAENDANMPATIVVSPDHRVSDLPSSATKRRHSSLLSSLPSCDRKRCTAVSWAARSPGIATTRVTRASICTSHSACPGGGGAPAAGGAASALGGTTSWITVSRVCSAPQRDNPIAFSTAAHTGGHHGAAAAAAMGSTAARVGPPLAAWRAARSPPSESGDVYTPPPGARHTQRPPARSASATVAVPVR